MKTKKIKRPGLLGLVFVTFLSIASSLVIIDARKAPYRDLTNVRDTSVLSEIEIRIAGLTQIAAKYRLLNGLGTLSTGSFFKVIWPDGSSEHAEVTNPFSSMGSIPVPGSQVLPGGSGGGIVEMPGVGGDNPFEACSAYTIKSGATSSSGTVCRYDSYLECPALLG